ncbi:hypothetical protein PRIC1_012027 [Phytophthora ramorum]
MHVAYRLSNAAFGFPEEDDADAEDGAIYVLVAVPDLESREPAKEPHPARKRRWDVLNDLLESNKRAKSDPAEASTDFPYDEVNNIVQVGSYEQLWKPIPDENLEVVQEYLAMLTEALGSSLCANERKHYILPVLTLRALMDVEGLTAVYCVVTNFVEWRFSRSVDGKLERDAAMMSSGNPGALKVVAGKIYAMLSEDEELLVSVAAVILETFIPPLALLK